MPKDKKFLSIVSLFVLSLGLVAGTRLIQQNQDLREKASGNTYYVATTGNDSNSGTISSPFKTIQRGVNSVSAGDTLLVRGGTYVEQVKITRSGTASSRITIKAYPNEQPIIDGQAGVDCLNCGLPGGTIVADRIDPKTGQGFNWNALLSIEANYIVFDGFTVTRSMGRGIRLWASNFIVKGITIRNSEIRGSRTAGILLQGTENVVIENSINTRSGSFAPWGLGRTPGTTGWPVSFSIIDSKRVTVRGNTVYENWGEGIAGKNSSNIIIEDNTVYDNISAQIYVHYLENATVQRNFIYHTNRVEFMSGDGNPPNGININNEKQFTGTYANTVDIVNNVSVGGRKNFVIFNNQGVNVSTDNFLIANNVFINAVNNRADRPSQSVGFLNTQYNNVKFENNIIYQGKIDSAHSVGNGKSQIDYSNNLWYPTRPSNSSGGGDVVGKDPQFVDSRAYQLPENWSGTPRKEWFKVKGSSPVVDAGKISSAFNATTNTKVDMFLAKRDSSPDIGIHEYGGYIPPTTPTPTIPVGNTPTPTLPPSITPTPIPTIVPGANILSNGSFEAGLVPWLFNPSSAGSLSSSSDAFDGLSSGKVVITDNADSTQLFQKDLVLESGVTYKLSFSAKSPSGNDLEMIVHKHSSPYTDYGLSEVFDITNNWKDFSTTFTASSFIGTVNDARLRFWFAPFDAVGDNYLIDNVKLEKITTTPTEPIGTPVPIPGDANGDRRVNGEDFVVWLFNYGQDVPNRMADGDFDGDGKVDGADFVIWLMNFGK